MKIFGAMAKSGGRHQPAVKMVAAIFCVGGAARLSYHHRPMCGGWRLGKSGGADIMVAKEAGRWCWVIIDQFEWSVSLPIKAIIVINSNYSN